LYYLEEGQEKNRRLRNAMLLACAAHVLFVAAVSFDYDTSGSHSPQIEVTLATRPSSQTPEEASRIAQSSQQGSAQEAESEVATSSQQLPVESLAPMPVAPLQSADEGPPDAELLATAAAAPRAVVDQRSEQEQRMTQQLAGLEAELDEQTRGLSDRPRVRRLTSVATKESADAAYLHSFLKRLEAVGNKYYPEASIRYGLYGSLRLLVAVRYDGSLEEIRVLKSSGFAVLDEAAIKTVRMAAPFAPFPAELAATTDKLEIIRTWHFEKNELSSNKAPAN
jgi:periplasmic protein TonB